MIRAVAFDLWETLITNTPELSVAQKTLRVESLERVLRDRGFDLDSASIDRAHHETWALLQELYWSIDLDVSCRRQIDHFLELLGVKVDDATIDVLEDAYARVVTKIPPQIVDGAREALRAMRDRDLRVGLISNTGRTPGSALREVLAQLDLAPSIDVMLFSNEHGECKPRPSIFRALHDALGVDYDEIAFVGDNLYVDVHGAQQNGMKGIHFIPPQRGTAIAPAVDHGLTIVPDATIRDLRKLSEVIDALSLVPHE